jgi:type I restriction enzyme S subunit
MELNLPLNWTVVKFGESCIFSQGIQVDVNLQSEVKKGDQVRFLRIIDFTQGDEPPRYIDNPGKKYFLEKDEIAMVRYGTVGFVCTGKEGVIANNLFKITPSEYLAKGYLINFLKSQFFKSKLESKGATMQALNFGLINPIEIPLPPIAEQKRIVAKIEELFSELDKGIESLKTAKQQLKVYRQAVLKYAFEGRLTNPEVKEGELPEGWVKINVKNFAKSIQYGYTESSNKVEIGPKFLRITDIQDNKVIWKNVPFCKIKESEKGKYLLQDGDLVFARTGATVGKSFLIKGDIPESVFASYLIRVRFPKEVNDFYVWYYFQSPFYWKQIIDKSVGTGQPNVNGTKLGELEVIFPTNLKDQLFIVQEIESRISVCDKIEESIEQGLQQAEALRQSILKKAFEGKLVSQDPNDEPAIILLERIKAERQKVQPEKKTKTKKVKA